MITTNRERQLPPAFVRRCVFLALEPMKSGELQRVAEAHFGAERIPGLYKELAGWLATLRDRAREAGMREPGTAEFLDAVRACRDLHLTPADPVWRDVAHAVMWKHESPLPAAGAAEQAEPAEEA